MIKAMVALLTEIGLIVGIAAFVSLLGRLVKQPPIIAYLITGVLVGPLFFNLIQGADQLQSLAHLGVALLLFIVGISLDFRVLKQVGGTSIVGGIATISIISLVTFFVAQALAFNSTSSLYLALAFSFSSTVVVVKILSDKKEIDTLHGQIALGILIIEDFVAAIALMVIPVLAGTNVTLISLQIVKSVSVIFGIFIFGKFALPKILDVAAKNQEVLFLCSLAWALIVGIIFNFIGLSTEIGALLAGMVIASSKYSLEIKSKVKGVRDFFVILFFVFFGSQLSSPISNQVIYQALIFSLVILIGKPLIVMTLMRSFGFKKRTNFLAGTSLTQVSEFSLIVLLLGFSIGHIPQSVFSLGILVTLITVFFSSYGIYFSQPIYEKLSSLLRIFDGNRREPGTAKNEKVYDIILLGYNRIGFNLLKAFKISKKNYLIIDYNPITIFNLSKKGINCLYGDVNDSDFLRTIKLNGAQVIISTIPEYSTNIAVRKLIENKNCIFIPTAHDISNALELYTKGADYVIMPHFLGGDFMANMLVRDNFNKKSLKREGENHIKELKERSDEGHQHPRKDFYGS